MFTKQHYAVIAEVLKANRPTEPTHRIYRGKQISSTKDRAARCLHHRCIVDQIGNLFVRDNPRFNWDAWLTATGERNPR